MKTISERRLLSKYLLILEFRDDAVLRSDEHPDIGHHQIVTWAVCSLRAVGSLPIGKFFKLGAACLKNKSLPRFLKKGWESLHY